VGESYQLWAQSGESCPEGTVPIRRTTEKDVLRASSIGRYGRKPRRHVRRDSSGSGHEVSSILKYLTSSKIRKIGNWKWKLNSGY
jgi:hypothetical protein